MASTSTYQGLVNGICVAEGSTEPEVIDKVTVYLQEHPTEVAPSVVIVRLAKHLPLGGPSQ